MVELKRDIFKTREKVYEEFTQYIDEANKIWYGVLRLIITLSSSFLVLTIALVEKLFPPIGGVINLPIFLTISWILLFLSIIFVTGDVLKGDTLGVSSLGRVWDLGFRVI
ncbi:MAG: hypothetical protein NTX01_08380 [Candidatus Omnitrophica bacterium]|nr:hypothetical protein [Candidatus Omnitrophota bacterium]MCX5699699.1 hypothetical protein [Candidatus Omnitrophota bacterium]